MVVAVFLWQHVPTTSQVDPNILLEHSLIDTVISGSTKYVHHDYDQTYVYDTILVVDVHVGTDTIQKSIVFVKSDSISIDGRRFVYPGAIDYATVTVLYSESTSFVTYQNPITKGWVLLEDARGSLQTYTSRLLAGAPVAFIRSGDGYLLTESGELFSTNQDSIIRLDSGLVVPAVNTLYGQSAKGTYRVGWQYEIVARYGVSYHKQNGDWGIAHSQMKRAARCDRIIPIDYESDYTEYDKDQLAFMANDTIMVMSNNRGTTIVKCIIPHDLVTSVQKVCVKPGGSLNEIAVVTMRSNHWDLLRYGKSEKQDEVRYLNGKPLALGTSSPRVVMFSRALYERFVFVSFGTYCEGGFPGFSMILNLESGEVVYKGKPIRIISVIDLEGSKGRDTISGIQCDNQVQFKYDLTSRRMVFYEAVTVECTSVWFCDDDPNRCIEALSVTYTNKTDKPQKINAVEIESVENLEDYSKKRKVLYRSDHSVDITLGPGEVLPVEKLFLKSKVRFYDGRQPHFYARVK